MSRALIVIDMQKGFVRQIFGAQKVIKNIKRLIDFFKKKKQSIIYIQDFHCCPNDPEFKKFGCHALKGTKKVEFIKELKPTKKDIIIRKKRLSAFFGTNLDKILKQKKIKEIYLVGIFTDFCVISTAIDGFMRDYEVFVVSGATSSFNKKCYQRGIEMISDMAGKAVKTKDLIRIKNKE